MNNYEQFKALYDLVIVTISSVLTAYLVIHLHTKINSKKLSTLFAVLVVSLFVVIANFTIETLISTYPGIREFIDKENFIEGYYNIIHDPIRCADIIAILKIDNNDGRYFVTGSTYTNTGRSIGTFTSNCTVYSNRVLFFKYESNYNNRNVVLGMDHLNFDINSPPNSYTGFFMDFKGDSSRMQSIAGYKITPDELGQYNKLNTPIMVSKFYLSKKIDCDSSATTSQLITIDKLNKSCIIGL
jgi:hypothetical protein